MKTRFRTHLALTVGDFVTPEHGDSHHLRSVLRARVGDELGVVDANGRLFLGHLQSLEPCVVKVTEEIALAGVNASRHVEAWVPLLKSKKTDGLIRQLTELGVAEIVVYLSERSVVRPNLSAVGKLLSRYERISVEATRQCRRTDTVRLRFSDSLPSVGDGFFLWEEDGEGVEHLWSHEMATFRLLVGPEGGLSAKEAQELQSKGWQPVHLGGRILRAETAVIAAVALAIYR